MAQPFAWLTNFGRRTRQDNHDEDASAPSLLSPRLVRDLELWRVREQTKGSKMKTAFNEDRIRRGDLPRDVFVLLHDIAYDHPGRDRRMYALAAQNILSSKTDLRDAIYMGWPDKAK